MKVIAINKASGVLLLAVVLLLRGTKTGARLLRSSGDEIHNNNDSIESPPRRMITSETSPDEEHVDSTNSYDPYNNTNGQQNNTDHQQNTTTVIPTVVSSAPSCGCQGRQDPVPFYVRGENDTTFLQARLMDPPNIIGATCMLARAPETDYQRIQMAKACKHSEKCWIGAIATQAYGSTMVCNTQYSGAFNQTECERVRSLFRNLGHTNLPDVNHAPIPFAFWANNEPNNYQSNDQFRLVISAFVSPNSGGLLFAEHGDETNRHKPLFQCCNDDIEETCPF